MSIEDKQSAAVTALLKKIELSPADIEAKLEAAFDIGQWRRLAPFASIEAESVDPPSIELGGGDFARAKEHLDDVGYFRMEHVFDRGRIARMLRTVEAVRAQGWPAAFAFVFDDFWSMARSPAVSSFIEASIGKGFLQNSVVWVHWVAGAEGASGWHPHSDYAGATKSFLSLWIPLVNATVENGCMFLVRPKGLSAETMAAIAARENLAFGQYSEALQNVVALPVPAGSLIGWRGDVLHWGGVNSGGATPRISLALEFRSAGGKTSPFERPLVDPRQGLPSFRMRLFAIAKALREYRKFEPLAARFLPLAEQIWSAGPPGL